MTYSIVHSHSSTPKGLVATATVTADSERDALEILWAHYGDNNVAIYSFR